MVGSGVEGPRLQRAVAAPGQPQGLTHADRGAGKCRDVHLVRHPHLAQHGAVAQRAQPLAQRGGLRRLAVAGGDSGAAVVPGKPADSPLLQRVLDGDEELSEDDALDALEQVGLAGREDLACKYLSQGQKRRVALARLVKEKRPLWILDEPFVALDTAAVDWLAGIISGHLQRGGMAVMTTHQQVNIPAGTIRELRLG